MPVNNFCAKPEPFYVKLHCKDLGSLQIKLIGMKIVCSCLRRSITTLVTVAFLSSISWHLGEMQIVLLDVLQQPVYIQKQRGILLIVTDLYFFL